MSLEPIEEIENALNTLSLPKLISKDDIKKQYRFLAKKITPIAVVTVKKWNRSIMHTSC